MIGKSLNHYRIVGPLGSGGMGEVWLAEDTKLHRKVALKILPPEMADNPERRSRFEREARAVAALNHPNIVTIYSVEEAAGVHFITMEAVEGRTLTDLIPPSGMGLGRFLELALPLADAVAAAHEQGIVHRDLKPDNVIVSNKGVLKVLDFGLAKLREDAPGSTEAVTQMPTAAVTAEGKVVGTVAYMSPEQAEGKAVDARSDVFSLGILFYQMTTGEKPFRGETTLSTLSSILKDTPRPITDINAGLPRDLACIINRCLVKTPPDRVQSAQGLRAELSTLKRESESGTLDAIRPPRAGSATRTILIAAGGVLLLAGAFGLWRLEPGRDAAPSSGPVEPAPAGSRQAPAEDRIVVLPFENLGAPEDGYFAAGVTEEITSRLAAVRDLSVISRTSAIQYAGAGKTIGQIGRELGVDYILEGTVRWEKAAGAGGRVRVTPTLIRVSDDSNLDRYDREMASIFEVQSEIAGAVVTQLGLTLGTPQREDLAARPTADMEAYKSYLQAKNLQVGPFDLEAPYTAEEHLNRAVALDPGFAEAWAELSKTHSRLYHDNLDHTEDRLGKSRAAADRALELAPDLPEARIALGYYYYWGRRDYERALAEFETASIGRPKGADILAAIGYIKRRQGRWEESTESLERALELDPRNLEVVDNLWGSYAQTGALGKADAMCEKAGELGWGTDMVDLCKARQMPQRGDWEGVERALSRHPDSEIPLFPIVRWFTHYRLGRLDSALEQTRHWPDSALVMGFGPEELARGLTYEKMGRAGEARKAYEEAVTLLLEHRKKEPENPIVRSQLALAYACLGRKEEAVQEARLAVDMLPISRDAVDGPSRLDDLARVYLRIGEPEKALDLLDQLLSIPSEVSVPLIETDPDWETVRDHPRYREILRKHR